MAKYSTISFGKGASATNLRPAVAPDGNVVLRPVGSLLSQPLLRGYTPLASVGAPDGTIRVILVRERQLVACPLDIAEFGSLEQFSCISPLPGEFRSFLSAGSSSVNIFTSSGLVAVCIGADGRPVWSELSSHYPAVSIMAEDASPLSRTVSARKLSMVYNDGGLSAADARALVNDLSGAYLSLCDTARAAGLAIQPLLARYKLFDADGSLLFTSVPVLLTHSSGTQCAASQALFSPDRQSVAAYSLSASTWRLRLWCEAAGEAIVSAVSRAEIYVSPLFHPFNPDAAGNATLTRATSDSQPFAHVSLPVSGSALSGAGGCSLLMQVLCRFDSLERLAAVIPHPFRSEAYSPANVSISFAAPDDDIRRLASALAAPLPAHSLITWDSAAVSAHLAAMASGVAAYAGFSLVASHPCSPAVAAASRFDSPYSLSVRVTLADGRSVGFDNAGASGAFNSLGPLLFCYLPDAVSMQVQITAGDITRTSNLPLSPLPDGSASVFIAGKALPFTIPEGSPGLLSEPEPLVRSFPQSIAFADAGAPGHILADAPIPGGEVMAVIPRMGSDQSWEFGRARFLLATRSAILSVAVDAARKKIAFRTLADTGIGRPDAICALPSSSVFAVIRQRIVEITPTGRIRTFADNSAYIALAWDSVNDELWALRSDRTCDIFCSRFHWQRFTRDDCSVSGFRPFSGGLCAVSESLDFVGIELPDRKTVEISGRCTTDKHRLCTPGQFIVNISGSGINASFDVWDCGISGHGKWPLLSAAIRGDIHSPLRFNYIGRPARSLDLNLTASVNPDFTYHSFLKKSSP